MNAQLLWEHSSAWTRKYNIYRDGQYYDTVHRHGSFGSYYDFDPTKDDHVYEIVSVEEFEGETVFSPRSAPLVKR